MSLCRSCQGEIIQCVTLHGKKITVDAEPSESGDLRLERRDAEIIAHYHQPNMLGESEDRYTRHEHRKKKSVTEPQRLPREVPVSSITVPENRLREIGDVDGLVESISAVGLLQPVIVTESGVLIAGNRRLAAVKRLGWTSVLAHPVEDDELVNRLIEIDENLKRQDLTVWDQGRHVAERERVLEALGQRASASDGPTLRGASPVTVTGDLKTTEQLAAEAGMGQRSWRRRSKIGREIGEQTATILDHADATDDSHRALLNSIKQLDKLANICKKEGDEKAAQIALTVLSEEGTNVFKEYDKLRGDDLDLPSFELSEARKAYYRVSRYLVGLTRLDPEEVAQECKSEIDALKDAEDAKKVIYWFGAYQAALEERAKEMQPGNLRRIQ